jgi:hypothetical protein
MPTNGSRGVRMPSSPDNWIGGTGNWSVASNWSMGLPGSSSDVTIFGSGVVTFDTDSSINTLTMDATMRAVGNRNLTIAGLLTVGGTGICACASGGFGTITAGGLINNGGIFFETSGVLQINGDATNGYLQTGPESGGHIINIIGTLTNVGFYQTFGGNDATTVGSLNNSGTVDVENMSSFTVKDNAINSGVLTTSGGYGGGQNTISVSGMLTNTASGQITLSGPGDVLTALAGLTNNGVININNGSSIDPPFVKNLGTVNIDSTSKFVVGTGKPSGLGYIQMANGTLGEMISATNSFGVINVNGSALLAGTLDILLQGGFNPRVGSIFQFLFADPGQLSGRFDNIENDIFNNGTERWDVTYDNADGIVELVAEERVVPEPATLLVLIPGLLGAGYGLRRKLLGSLL